jgi:uncharacterized protein (DUF2236 family)
MTQAQRAATVRPLPETGRRRPIQPGTRLWDEAGLITFSLTTGSAFALQTMHPTVGEVVAEHSTFRTDAIGRAVRSLGSVMTWVYGGEAALAEGDRLRAMHAPLKSVDEHGVTHHALASGPWAWIVLTAPYAFASSQKYFGRRPLTEAEQESIYQEIVQIMRNLHVAEKEIPPTYPDYLELFEDVLANTLVAHPTTYDFLATARRVPPPLQLPRVLRPLWRVLMYLPGRLQYFVTVGTLPESARQRLGLSWTANDERRLRRLGWLIARVVPLLPERLRYLPIAYEARLAQRAEQRLQHLLQHRPM